MSKLKSIYSKNGVDTESTENDVEMVQPYHQYYARREHNLLTEEKCYNNVMELHGVNQFKELIISLRKLNEKRIRLSLPAPMLPYYLFVANIGCGISHCLDAFAKYLCSAGLFDFKGKVNFFEHKFGYVNPYAPQDLRNELDKLDKAITNNKGFNRKFKGLVAININEWIQYTNEKNFYHFLDHIANKSDCILVVLFVTTDNKVDVMNIEAPMKARLRSETIWFDFPKAEELVGGIVSKFFNQHRLNLTDCSKSLLKETIEEIVTGDHFKGYKTINQFNNDIFKKLFDSDFDETEISADMLYSLGFGKKSSYVKMKTSAGARKVGFGTHNVDISK